MSQPIRPPDSPLFERLWQVQSGCCALCGKPMPRSRFEVAHATIWKRERPTFDHIVPRAAGGPDRSRALSKSSAWISFRKRGEPVTFVRSPIMRKLLKFVALAESADMGRGG